MADKFGRIESDDDSPVRKVFKPSLDFDTSNKPSSIEPSSTSNQAKPSISASNAISNANDKPQTNNEEQEKRKNINRGSIIVNERQRGNPLLKAFQINSYYFEKILPDYIIGSKCCVLFLSLKYHNMYPQYIYDRMNAIGSSYSLKILLILIDVLDANHSLKEMIKISALADFALMCAWSFEEAGRILDTYKCFEYKSPESIMDKKISGKTNHHQCNLDALSSIKTINKTDSLSLISSFGTLESIIKSSKHQLEICPGLGQTKAEVLSKFFKKPFKREN